MVTVKRRNARAQSRSRDADPAGCRMCFIGSRFSRRHRGVGLEQDSKRMTGGGVLRAMTTVTPLSALVACKTLGDRSNGQMWWWWCRRKMTTGKVTDQRLSSGSWPLSDARFLFGRTDCVELKGSFADAALYRQPYRSSWSKHETGTRALTMAWKAPNRVRRAQGSEGSMLVMLCSPKGTLLDRGRVAVGGGVKRCILARLSGGAEPAHGGSWSFGLGGVSHVGGDATAREIFPRLGSSQRLGSS